jgi:hypothetical protein
MEVKFIDYGLGYNEDGVIKINKCLREDYKVFEEVLAHEKNHAQGEFTLGDLWHDIKPFSFRTMWFMLKHPSTWWCISPVWWNGTDVCVDVSSMLFIGIGLMVGGVGWILIL